MDVIELPQPCYLCEQDVYKSEYADIHSLAIPGIGFISFACPCSRVKFEKATQPKCTEDC